MILFAALLGLSIFLALKGVRGSFRNSKRVMLLLFASWLFFSSFFLLMEQLSSKAVSRSSGSSHRIGLPACFAGKREAA